MIIMMNILEVLLVIVPALLGVAYVTVAERKTMASMQRRLGPVERFGKSYLWDKLPNSGGPLKLLVPSNIWKDISGPINNWGKVTSQKICENKMSYRGSKSTVVKNTVEKEQRVDGSYINNLVLRSTLMGSVSSYPIRILSNQINKLRHYSTNSDSKLHDYILNPHFITGFADAESSFMILILKDRRPAMQGEQIIKLVEQ